jgi:type IV fimbrial biogenesis protein FimT
MRQIKFGTAHKGFTLIELVITMILVAIMAAFVVPTFRQMSADGAIRSSAVDLITAIHTARAQAVSLRRDVTLISPGSDGNWSDGWTVQYPAGTSSEENQNFLPGGAVEVKTVGDEPSIVFGSRGLTGAGGSVVFEVCDDRTGETGRKITVSPFGKVTNENKDCS